MTLPPFDLHRAGSVEDAAELLRRYGDDAAVHCGGTELLLLLKLGFASYGHLVDIKPIPELKGIAIEDGTLRIGAAVTHREIERSPLVAEALPALAAMERRVANVRVRSVGTLGGNLCFSDPHSDPAGFLLALDALAECRDGSRAARLVPLSEFLLGPYQTALRPAELLTAVCIPLPATGTTIVHDKISFHERPAATITVAVREESGVYADVRIAIGSVGPSAVRPHEAERILVGSQTSDEAALDRTIEAAALAAEPVEDGNGSKEYKANLVKVLVRRSIARALHGHGP
jgi:aerobic carbon-monoxide dehydrogenase medium subunit